MKNVVAVTETLTMCAETLRPMEVMPGAPGVTVQMENEQVKIWTTDPFIRELMVENEALKENLREETEWGRIERKHSEELALMFSKLNVKVNSADFWARLKYLFTGKLS